MRLRHLLAVLAIAVLPGSASVVCAQVETKENCVHVYLLSSSLQQAKEWQKMHDTLMYFVENCTGVVQTYGAFSGMNGSNQFRNNDLNRYPEHREWLKKVLYYDLDTLYYCEDVFSMLKTFRFWDSAHGSYSEGAITVAKYLVDSAKCGNLRGALLEDISEEWAEVYSKWKDTVTDSLATPFNTSLPTLDELGLAILRGPQADVVSPLHENRILSLSAVQNPFTDALDLKYTLDHSAMVRIDIHDLLGRTFYAEGQGYKPMGEHRLSLQTYDWAAGTYYVRLSTPSGEVQTVKVIKE